MPTGTTSVRAPTGRLARTITDALLAALLAPHCAACDTPLDRPSSGPVCATCWSAIDPLAEPLCRTCGLSLPSWRRPSPDLDQCSPCRRRRIGIDLARSAGVYEGALRRIVHALKYDGRQSLANPLAVHMREAGGVVLANATCVVPVPLHPWKRVRRGFNQATLLAEQLGLPVVHALWRIRATAPQSALGAAARRRNVRDAFRLSPILGKTAQASLRQAVVVLVDDVSTTGATLDACARVLRVHGVGEVRALTAARAPYSTAVRPTGPASVDTAA